jgi:hypothetical protein
MKIKRGKHGGVEFIGKNTRLEIIIDDTNKDIVIKVFNNGDEISIINPGEYEYGDIGIVAMEVSENGFSGRINLIRASIENVSCLFIPDDMKITKEIKDAMGICNILIISDVQPNSLKNLIETFNSEFVVFNNNANVEEYSNVIKKQFGVDNIRQEKSLSVDQKDFETDEDSLVTFIQLLD